MKNLTKLLFALLLCLTYANAIVYEDSEDKTTTKWNIYDSKPAGAYVANVYDTEKQSYVIQLVGTGIANGSRIGSENISNGWNNTTDRVLKWSMKYSENYLIYVHVQTTNGDRYLHYSSRNVNNGKNKKNKKNLNNAKNRNYIHHGLGIDSKNGTWQTFQRDLDADLKEFESDNEIIAVNGFLIKGSGRIDDIELKQTANTTPIITNTMQGNWSSVGVEEISTEGSSQTKIVLDSNDVPYILYTDYANGYKATVKKFDGSSWQTVGTEGISIGQTWNQAIAIDNNDIPYIIYADEGNQGKITVKKFDGVSWVTVGLEGLSSNNYSNSVSLAIDKNNTPYAVYSDGTTMKTTVMKFDGTSWITQWVSSSESDENKIVIDSNNTPYLAYRDYANFEKATVKKFDGTSWVTVGTEGLSLGGAGDISITLDNNNVLYIAYVDGANLRKTTVKKFDGTSWVTVGIEGFSSDRAWDPSIKINSRNTPYIIYEDGGNLSKATVKKFDGTSWVAVGSEGFTINKAYYPSLVIDSNDTPFVIYQDHSKSRNVTVQKYETIYVNNVLENQLEAIEVNAVNTNTNINYKLSYSLMNSLDYSLFDINADTGLITFKTAPDYENPTDLNGDNVYEFEVKVINTKGEFTVQSFQILVENDVATTPIITNNTQGNWTTVGTEAFSAGRAVNPSLAINSKDTSYVSYSDDANGHKSTVKKFDGTSWVTVGTEGFSASEAYNTSLAIDSNDIPYIVYEDNTYLRKVTVKKFDGTSWVTVGTEGFSSGYAGRPKIKINGNNTPYVLYSDDANGYKATVKKFDGTSWVTVGTEGFSVLNVSNAFMAIDNNDVPYVTYRDGANESKATVKKFDGISWVTVGIEGFSDGRVYGPALALNSKNIPYVVYQDKANLINKATVKKFDGTSWVTVGSDSDLQGEIDDPKIAIDSNDIPYIVYEDDNNPYKSGVKKFDGTSWVSVGTEWIAEGEADDPSIAIDSNDIPYVVYEDDVNFDKVTVKKIGTDIFKIIQENKTEVIDIDATSTNYTVTYSLENSLDAYLFNITADTGIITFKSAQDFENPNDLDGNNLYDFDLKVTNSIGEFIIQRVQIAIEDVDEIVPATPELIVPMVTTEKDSVDVEVMGEAYSEIFVNGISTNTFIDANGKATISLDTSGVYGDKNFSITLNDSTGNTSDSFSFVIERNPAAPVISNVKKEGWFDVNIDGFSSSSVYFASSDIDIAIDSNNTPYIVFQDTMYLVKKFDGVSWVTVGTEGFAIINSIAVDNNNIPYIAYSGTVKKFDGTSWVTVGIEGFSTGGAYQPSITIDNNNIPYVVYSDTANGYKTTVKKFDGTSWATVGIEGFSTGSSFSENLIAIDNNNIPYVLYLDSTYSNKATVKKFDGTSWVTVGTEGFSNEYIQFPTLAIDSNNVPYVGYKAESVTGGYNRAIVKKFDGTLWVTVGIEGFSNDNALYTSMAIDNDNVPYIVYRDGTNSNKVTVKKYNGISWVNLGLEGFSETPGGNTVISIDSNNVPYVAYSDYTNTNKKAVKRYNNHFENSVFENQLEAMNIDATDINNNLLTYSILDSDDSLLFNIDATTGEITFKVAPDFENPSDKDGNNIYEFDIKVMSTEGGVAIEKVKITVQDITPEVSNIKEEGWVNVGIEGFSLNDSYYNSSTMPIAINENNVPYVFYRDSENLDKSTVKKFDGTSWVTVGIESFSTAETSDIAIAIDSNNIPYVAYEDTENSWKLTVKKFDGTSWITVGTPGSFGTGDDVSIAIDSNNVPFVVFSQEVKKFNGTSWVNVGNGDFTSIRYTSIAIDGNNIPYIAYLEYQNSNWRATVKKFDGASWIKILDEDFLEGEITNTKIVIDNNNIPYIVYSNKRIISSVSLNQITVKKFDGTSWQAVGVEGSSIAHGEFITMAIDKNNVPYIAYNDVDNSDAATIKKFDGSYWVTVGTTSSVGETSNPSLAIDNNNNIYIAYQDAGNLLKGTVEKYNNHFQNSIYENDLNAIDIDASDINNDAVTYSLVNSTDASLFNMDVDTGVITFKTEPDFEYPSDTDGNNIYEFDIKVINTDGEFTIQRVKIIVEDIVE